MKTKTIDPVNIIDLSDEQLTKMQDIYKQVLASESETIKQIYRSNEINYFELRDKMRLWKRQPIWKDNNLGRVFFALDEEKEIRGFILSFDSLYLTNPKSFPIELIRHFLSHEYSYIKDLSRIGHFCFLSQIIIEKELRNRKLGSELISKYVDFYTNSHIYEKAKDTYFPSTILIGGTIHSKHYRLIKWFSPKSKKSSKSDYDLIFIDYYRDSNTDDIYFRTIKILRNDDFYIAVKSVNETFKTVIPIQLNLTIRSINALIAPLNAKVIWSSFFQFDAPFLSNDINLDELYNSFYTPLLNNNKKTYLKNLRTLNDILIYLSKKDKNSELASLSPKLRRGGFNFFLTNDEPKAYNMPDFADSVILNLATLDVKHLLQQKVLSIGKGHEPDDIKLWNKFLTHNFIKGQLRKPLSPEEIAQCKKWKDQKLITGGEWHELATLVRARNNRSIDEDGIQRLNEIAHRRLMTQDNYKKWEDWIHLHKTMYETDKICMKKNQKWCHAVIPMSFVDGVSGIMVTLIYDSTKGDKNWLNHLILNITNSLSKNMFNVIVRLMKSRMQKTLLKHAIASISTRNLAHNFGSHIITKLSSPKHIRDFIKITDDSEINAKRLNDFFVYLRTRMDFLADISTSEPVSSISRKLDKEVLALFRKQHIITNYISGSKVNEVRINYYNSLQNQKKTKDIAIQLPNGNLGAHALYIIFENIIRNSVKHSSSSFPDKTIALLVKVINRNSKRGYFIQVSDNVLKSKKEGEILVTQISEKFIKAKIVPNGKQIRAKGWGIGEMKMATSYLRKKVPSEYLDKGNHEMDHPLLRALFVEDKDQKGYGYLTYEFYLKKPRKFIAIDSHNMLSDFKDKEDWKNEGVKILSFNKLSTDYQHQIHSHEIIVLLDKNVERKTIEKHKNFPLRWIEIKELNDQLELKKLLDYSVEDTFSFLWEKWTKGFLKSKEIHRELYPILRDDGEDESVLDTVDQIFNLQNHDDILLFDLHANAQKEKDINPDSLGFYEASGTQGPTGKIIQDFPELTAIEKQRLQWELIEAATTEVIIIDERIQYDVTKKDYNPEISGADYFDILKWMNIYIPRIEDIDLYKEKYEKEDIKKLDNWLFDYLGNYKIDFCVIHLGIIEKLFGTKSEDISHFLDQKIRALNKRPEIVLISGRGEPHEMPRETLFLNYSNISKYLLEERSKFHLCKMLFSARTRIIGYGT